jgi:hypothetical protein
MGPVISAASKEYNIFSFALIPLRYRFCKEAKIKEKVEAAIHGFKEIGSLISKSKHNQQRKKFDRKDTQDISASQLEEHDFFVSDMGVLRILF